MLKNRLIPVVLLRNGVVVQSKGFTRFQILGNPVTIVKRLTDWAADELICLDISRETKYDQNRSDLKCIYHNTIIKIIEDISQHCFMPMTFGGTICSLKDAEIRIQAGADKISINSRALEQPDLITICAKEMGSQCIVISIDARRGADGCYEVFSHGGKIATGRKPTDWATEAASRGAGEILINSIDKDGIGNGYDIALIDSIVSAVNIPVIALGGAGSWNHFSECLSLTNVSAVAAANIFHYTENSVYKAKEFLFASGMNVRKPTFGILDR